MMRKLSVIFIISTMMNCTTLQENSPRGVYDREPAAEAFHRARGLYQVGETKAALRTLKGIIDENPFGRLSLDAALFSVDIYVAQKQPEKALDILSYFENRVKSKKKTDLSRYYAARERVETLLKTSSRKVDEKQAENIGPAAPAAVVTSNEQPLTGGREISRSIGVLLPLSGPYKVYGERALASMRLALDPVSAENANDALVLKNQRGLSVIVLDTKGQGEVAERAVDRLVTEFKVGVIVGDILSDTALAIANRAKVRDVINLSLSRKEGLTAVGSKIFRIAMTAKKQAAALLSVGAQKKEIKRYAILYPQNAFGTEMRDAFVNEAKKRGASVVKVEGYKPDETTFTENVRHLVGPKKITGNIVYEQCLEKAQRLVDNSARKKAEKDCYEAVAPSIGFDALFIPEFPKTLGYIVPALISEGIMVSQNEGMVRAHRKTSHVLDAEPVQLLGPNSWNNALVGEKLGAQVEGALFVDGVDFLDGRDEVSRFVDGFKHASISPPGLADAFAFDAIRTIQEIFASLNERTSITAEDLANGLQRIQYTGVSGKISFDDERESVIPFRWFAFHEGKIHPQS